MAAIHSQHCTQDRASHTVTLESLAPCSPELWSSAEPQRASPRAPLRVCAGPQRHISAAMSSLSSRSCSLAVRADANASALPSVATDAAASSAASGASPAPSPANPP